MELKIEAAEGKKSSENALKSAAERVTCLKRRRPRESELVC